MSTAPLWDALREVLDPELPISVVDLGIVYDIRRDRGDVEVDLTFTATACPCTAFIREDIETRLMQEPSVTSVSIREVWSPAWTKERVSETGRARLKEFGISL